MYTARYSTQQITTLTRFHSSSFYLNQKMLEFLQSVSSMHPIHFIDARVKIQKILSKVATNTFSPSCILGVATSVDFVLTEDDFNQFLWTRECRFNIVCSCLDLEDILSTFTASKINSFNNQMPCDSLQVYLFKAICVQYTLIQNCLQRSTLKPLR